MFSPYTNKEGINYSDGTNASNFESNYNVTYGDIFTTDKAEYIQEHQEILLDGEYIGLLRKQYGKATKELEQVAFILYVDEEIDSDYYLEDGSWFYLSFAKLQDCIEWYLENKDKVNKN